MELIDEFTDMTWSIPLRSKGQAYDELRRWEKQRELETGEVVGIYRTDNGELKSNRMREWLATKGTQQEFTAPYTSAHNGVAERRHRTIFALARTMRAACNAPFYLWDYFVETAAHIAQRRPTTYQNKKTPYEAWYGRKPDLSYLREIGCAAFVLIPNKSNPKIYDRSLECKLIGYSNDSKAYICYHTKSRKVITSYHVQFVESFQTHPRPLLPHKMAGDSGIPPPVDDLQPPAVQQPSDDDHTLRQPCSGNPSETNRT
ncbi:unnamed protein product [Peniophora sp. CBMAI 1063]|nr:unnamed protein product [Peniophora sp. CBMAI 1063]